jgi:rubrerythrin
MKEDKEIMKTETNLKTAFAGESQANRKYLAYAERAEKENLPGVAKLFRAAAAAETVHAHKHLSVLQGATTTRQNLEDAIAGEIYEFKSMYPQMIADAEAEDAKQALLSFRYANEVEKIHAELYKKALEEMEKFPIQDYFVCKICGYTVAKEAPDKCPVCGATRQNFFKVD